MDIHGVMIAVQRVARYLEVGDDAKLLTHVISEAPLLLLSLIHI